MTATLNVTVAKKKKAHTSIYLSLKVMNHTSKVIVFFSFYQLSRTKCGLTNILTNNEYQYK